MFITLKLIFQFVNKNIFIKFFFFFDDFLNLNVYFLMKNLFVFISFFVSPIFLKSEVTLKAQTSENKDINCITLLQIASEKSKKEGEMVKYEKLKSLQQKYISKYSENHFSNDLLQLNIDDHNLKIKEKGKRYINKGLQKCGLK